MKMLFKYSEVQYREDGRMDTSTRRTKSFYADFDVKEVIKRKRDNFFGGIVEKVVAEIDGEEIILVFELESDGKSYNITDEKGLLWGILVLSEPVERGTSVIDAKNFWKYMIPLDDKYRR